MNQTELEQQLASTRAQREFIKESWGSKVMRWCKKLPPPDVLIMTIVVTAVLIILTAWEANNSGSGWAMIAKGTAPAWFAYLAGVALTITYVVFHRRSSELRRNKGPWRKSAMVALIAALISLAGVFSNLASKTGTSQLYAQETTQDRAEVRIRIKQLEAELASDPLTQFNALIQATDRTIKSLEAEAVGWGMADTEPDGACAADLYPRQRTICQQLNGTEDVRGLRNDLVIYQASYDQAQSKTEELARKREELKGLGIVEGAAHWQAMSDMVGTVNAGAKVDADLFRIWASFLFAAFILFLSGLGWDTLTERVERRLEDMENLT